MIHPTFPKSVSPGRQPLIPRLAVTGTPYCIGIQLRVRFVFAFLEGEVT